jgi:hypothetical protein
MLPLPKEGKVVVLYISQTLRKAGDINDPYSIFTRLVMTGRFDQVFQQLNVRIPPRHITASKNSVIFGSLSHDPSTGLTGVLAFALVPVELLLQALLSISGLAQGSHWNLELLTAKLAYPNGRGRREPFNYP